MANSIANESTHLKKLSSPSRRKRRGRAAWRECEPITGAVEKARSRRLQSGKHGRGVASAAPLRLCAPHRSAKTRLIPSAAQSLPQIALRGHLHCGIQRSPHCDAYFFIPAARTANVPPLRRGSMPCRRHRSPDSNARGTESPTGYSQRERQRRSTKPLLPHRIFGESASAIKDLISVSC